MLIKKKLIALANCLSPFSDVWMRFHSEWNDIQYFQFGVWSISYDCLHEIPLNEIRCVISLRSFWIKWNLISSDKIFWKHYPKMKPFEKKHLHLRIFNWNKYSRSKDQNKNSWKIMYMKTNVNRILFMAKRNFISVKYGFVSNLNTFLQWTYPS